MREWIIPFTALFVLAVAVSAQAQMVSSVGLFTDEQASECEVWNTGGFAPFAVWIFSWPGMDGTMCTEFALSYPGNVVQHTVTWNMQIISVSLGDPASGLSVCYSSCQYDLIWICCQACYLTDTEATYIKIVRHPEVGVYQYANCDPGFPTKPFAIVNSLALNQECLIGENAASWGAIKNMIND